MLLCKMAGVDEANVTLEIKSCQPRPQNAMRCETIWHHGDAHARCHQCQRALVAGSPGGKERPHAAAGEMSTGFPQNLALPTNDLSMPG